MKKNSYKNCGSYYEITAWCKGVEYVIYVDASDYNKVKDMQWSISPNGYTAYALTKLNGKVTTMHKLLFNPGTGMVCDHINRNGLDNRRENVRVSNSVNNIGNSGIYRNKKIPYKNIYQTGANHYKIYIQGLPAHYFTGPITAQHIETANAMRVQKYGEYAFADTFKGELQ